MDNTDPAAAPRKTSLIEWLVVLAIIGIIAAIAIPGILSSQRASNERYASTTLKTFSTAQADFRANDRDWNAVNDFWTGDVKGLYTMTPAKVLGNKGGPDDLPIRLIELRAAAADGDEAFYPAGGENMPLSDFATPQPSVGYWFLALSFDQCMAGTAEMTYRQNTGGKPDMGSCHNTSKFGFAAIPHLSSTGKFIFRVNENNTIFREGLTGPARSGTSRPPGRAAFPAAYLDWPTDEVLKGPKGGDESTVKVSATQES